MNERTRYRRLSLITGVVIALIILFAGWFSHRHIADEGTPAYLKPLTSFQHSSTKQPVLEVAKKLIYSLTSPSSSL